MTDELRHDPSQMSLLELFLGEVETQVGVMGAMMLELERAPDASAALQELMRAAHSLKGAARIVNQQSVVSIAHAMEDCFVAAQRSRLQLKRAEIDVLLRSVDLLGQLARHSLADLPAWETDFAADIQRTLGELKNLASEGKRSVRDPEPALAPNAASVVEPPQPAKPAPEPLSAPDQLAESPDTVPIPAIWSKPPYPAARARHETTERVVRLTAESLNRLLGLAGESLVESRWLRPFTDSLQQLKRCHASVVARIESLRQELESQKVSESTKTHFSEIFQHLTEARHFLADRMQELEVYDRRSAQLSHRLYLEVLRTRMRPFSDGVRRFPRMVRDLARSLGKEVSFELTGENTQVDRDILERLETPLAHLLRNAVDHGCETPGERERVGKAPECVLRLDAHHSAGMLVVSVSDDGRGVDLEQLRQIIVERNFAQPGLAERLTETELLEFLFLPGFTLKETVSEISGRGVGLDAVQNMIRSVRGAIRVNNQAGRGFRIQLQLPLTLSVVRVLLIEVDGEPYAIPLSQILRTLQLPASQLQYLEGRCHFLLGGQQVGVVTAHQVLDCGSPQSPRNELSFVLLGDRTTRYAILVDRLLGERELVVQPLDHRLGKIRNVSATAIMEDGAPVLILDVDELLRSIEQVVVGMPWPPLPETRVPALPQRTKRILAVDDSATVRELERKLLTTEGFDAHVAASGADAWHLARTGQYDLVLTDLQMPGLDGLQLTKLIKADPMLRNIPVIILSVRDSEEDRLLGLESGADFYLTKGNFQDQSLVKKIVELIGSPSERLMIDG